MSRVNRSKGNMYGWVTHTWSPMVGCPHQCSYCYIRTYRDLPVEPRLSLPFSPLGFNRTIFVGHLCDMFANSVPSDWLFQILEHCMLFGNMYIFQSKNPARMAWMTGGFIGKLVVGTTIETNRQDILDKISKAPPVIERADSMSAIDWTKFVTVEPIIDFDVESLVELIVRTGAAFVNIGADSKRHGLPEPSAGKIIRFMKALEERRIKILRKQNLGRIWGKLYSPK